MSTAPTTIGPYAITREIGRGGMGVVYLANDTRLDRQVAIKALPEHLANDPDRLSRFEREAKTLATLNHPNIAAIYGFESHPRAADFSRDDEHSERAADFSPRSHSDPKGAIAPDESRRLKPAAQDETYYLILEYVEGETLAERLDRGPLPVDEALEVCTQIAAGVEAAHEAGVIHRDLKPGNIIITPEGKVKVLDFGLAKVAESSSSSSFHQAETVTSPVYRQHSPTMPGVILGTAAYMSPEQARGRSIDKRTDIWSFGVVLYECLAGLNPFVGETVTDSIGAILHKDVDLNQLPPQTPPNVHRVLDRCLVRDRNLRFRDIGDVRIELEMPLESALAERKGRPIPVAMLLIVAIVFGLAGAGAAWILNPKPTPAPTAQNAPAPSLHLTIPLPEGLEIVGPVAISRDGAQLAFAASDDAGEQYVYLRKLHSFDLIRIEGGREGGYPFFSPDGTSLGFFARNAIWRVFTDGGAPTRLTREGLIIGADWMDDDTIIYSTGLDSPIKRITSSGAPLEPITSLEATGSYAHVWPQQIPGTNRVLFTAWGGRGGVRGGGHILDRTTKVARPLTDASGFIPPGRWSASGHILFEPPGDGLFAAPFDPESEKPLPASDAKLLMEQVHDLGNWLTHSAFALSDNGVLAYVSAVGSNRRLVQIYADGAVRTVLEQAEVADYTRLGGNIAISSDSRHALIGASGDILLVDLERGMPRRLTSHERSSITPVWSHDERHVIFLSNREDRWKIWSVSIDGSTAPEMIVEQEYNVLHPVVGPNGEIAFTVVDPDTSHDIWIRDPDGSQRPVLRTQHDEETPHFSPDGEFLAYASNVSGHFEVYIIPTSGRRVPEQVSKGGGTAPKWSRDGEHLMYRKGRAIMRIAVHKGRPVGDAKPIFDAPNLAKGGRDYDIAPNGQSMLAVQIDADAVPNEIRIVTNFFEEIRRVAGEGAIVENKP